MKKRSGLSLAAMLIFALSLSVLLYSAWQALRAPVEAKSALQGWEKKREEALALAAVSASAQPAAAAEEETPLTDNMVALPGTADSAGSLSYTGGEIIGMITFPKLDKSVAVLEGTGRAQLKKGAGHYAGSAAIGAAGNSVLAGHRDTVFRGLGKLKPHDTIEIETAEGTFIYEVTGSRIVDGDERGAIQASDQAVLTLITCYPFSYVGPAPDRYLLSAALVRHEPLAASSP